MENKQNIAQSIKTFMEMRSKPVFQKLMERFSGNAQPVNNMAAPIVSAQREPETDPSFDILPEGFDKPVPQEYRPYIMEASKHTKIPPAKLRAQFGMENAESWNPQLKGYLDPEDYGMTQLNPTAIEEITKPRAGGKSFFEQNFNEKFDIENPRHQILGSAVYMNWLRQFALPEQGIKNPTDEDVSIAYNMGAKRYARTIGGGGDGEDNRKLEKYKELLTKHNYYK